MPLLPAIQDCIHPLQCANNPLMNFTEMHFLLRNVLRQRLDEDTSFSVKLLRQTSGLSQGHLSNFLQNKRSISNRTADRILKAQGLDVERLLNSKELPGEKSQDLIAELRVAVPIVSEIAAINAPFASSSTEIALLPLPPGALRFISARPTRRRLNWERFVAIRIPSQHAFAMEPLIFPEALVVIDRHDNSLKREDTQRYPLYAVCNGGHLAIRYVTRKADRLILRPHNRNHQVELIEIDPDQPLEKWIVGRVVYVLNKLVP